MKTETLEQFLARGGKIQRVAYQQPEFKEVSAKKTTTGPAVLFATTASTLGVDPSKISNLSHEEMTEMAKLADSGVDISELSFRSPDLETAELYYGEGNKRSKKLLSPVEEPTIDLGALDPSFLEQLKRAGKVNGR